MPVHTYIQDLAGVAHDDIDPSVFSISGDEQMVRCPVTVYKILWGAKCVKKKLPLFIYLCVYL